MSKGGNDRWDWGSEERNHDATYMLKVRGPSSQYGRGTHFAIGALPGLPTARQAAAAMDASTRLCGVVGAMTTSAREPRPR